MPKLLKSIGVVCIAFLFANGLFAQGLEHVLGDVIIEVRHERGVQTLMRDLSANASYRSSMQARQIMKSPMNLWLISINPNEVNEIDFLEDVKRNHNVLLAQKNHLTHYRGIPNDPNFDQQWQYINMGQSGGLEGADIDMELAWDITTGGLTTDGDTIVVCVIDDGINLDHPDLQGNIWSNRFEIPGNEIDDDNNGYIDDVRGWNAYDDTDDVTIDGSHGTPVAGIVGAKGNNEVGVAGVNWDVKMMIVRGGGPEATAIASYAYPYTMRKLYNDTNGEKGAFVVSANSSWGTDFGQPEDAPIWCDFYNLMGEVGILNFGATINSNVDVDAEGDLPTACDSKYLVSVTNIMRNDQKRSSAGFGTRTIDLGAFGHETYTLTRNDYGGFGGTSGATPHVAGTAALLYSVDCPDFIALAKSDPARAALVVKDCILHGIDPNESLAGITTTEGRLNANNSILNLVASCGDCSDALGGDMIEVTEATGVFTWYDNGNSGATSLRYKEISSEEWIEIENVSSGFQLEGLTACAIYEFQTKTVCDSNPDATYTYSRTFETDGCCDIPTDIVISLEGDMATITWESVLAATNYIVEWKNLADDEWNVVDLGESNSFLLEGVFECEFFEVRVKSLCNNVNTESTFSEIVFVNQDCDGCTKDFCEFGPKNISDEWIEEVEIEGVFINTSGVQEDGNGNFLGQFVIDLITGETYTLNLTPGYSGLAFDEFFSAYIDFNQDGIFQIEENIFMNEESTQETVTDIFTVPETAITGQARMRIIMRFNASNGPCDESGFEFGEIEEYCVNIMNEIECPDRIEASVVDTTLSSLTFALAESVSIDSYIMLFRQNELTDFDTITTDSPVFTFQSLSECTEYEYRPGFICLGETVIDSMSYFMRTKCESSTQTFESLSLSLSPNPTHGNLNISFDRPIDQDMKIQLLSSDGRQVHTDYSIREGHSSLAIDASDLPQGIYFVRASMGNRFIIEKWVKY